MKEKRNRRRMRMGHGNVVFLLCILSIRTEPDTRRSVTFPEWYHIFPFKPANEILEISELE